MSFFKKIINNCITMELLCTTKTFDTCTRIKSWKYYYLKKYSSNKNRGKKIVTRQVNLIKGRKVAKRSSNFYKHQTLLLFRLLLYK